MIESGNIDKKNVCADNLNGKNKFVFRTKLSVVDYMNLVERIVKSHFNSVTGEYEPHFGRISSIQLFYEYCVESSDIDSKLPNGVVGLNEIEILVKEPCFMRKYYNEIDSYSCDGLHFGDAYACAIDIIAEKRNSPDKIVNAINKAIKNDFSLIWKALTSEKMKDLATIVNSEDFNPKGVADTIIKNYAKSEEFKALLTKAKAESKSE